jgi:hypothetical protein
MPMDSEVFAQFQRGSGGEMGTAERPGKMHSLNSSSALAYNFFAPWRGKIDLQPFADAMNRRLDAPIEFERQFPHGLKDEHGRDATPPNLDVAIGGEQPLAIECKFMAPYYGFARSKNFLKPAYFEGNLRRWADEGLTKCQDMAEALGQGLQFRCLDAAQLLKHLLGIAHATKRAPRLLCLWFDNGSTQACDHGAELEKFAGLLDDAVKFSALTYQAASCRVTACWKPPSMVSTLGGARGGDREEPPYSIAMSSVRLVRTLRSRRLEQPPYPVRIPCRRRPQPRSPMRSSRLACSASDGAARTISRLPRNATVWRMAS